MGVSTLVEFLHKKGFADITEDLNQKLSDEQYNLLVAEYSQDKTIREEATRFLQDRLNRKSGPEEPVQEEKPARKEPEMIETVIPDEPVIKFKTVGKINLDKPKEEPKEEPAPAKEPAKPVAQPKEKPAEPKKPVEKPVKSAQPAKAQEPKVKADEPKAEPVKVEPKPEPVAPEVKPEPVKPEPVKPEPVKPEPPAVDVPKNVEVVDNDDLKKQVETLVKEQLERERKEQQERERLEREQKEHKRSYNKYYQRKRIRHSSAN